MHSAISCYTITVMATYIYEKSPVSNNNDKNINREHQLRAFNENH